MSNNATRVNPVSLEACNVLAIDAAGPNQKFIIMGKAAKRRRMAAYNNKKNTEALIIASCEFARNLSAGTGYDPATNGKMTRKVKRDSYEFGGFEKDCRVEFARNSQRHQSKFGLSGRTKQYKTERLAVDPKQGSRYIRN